jgi:hypothetical protein
MHYSVVVTWHYISSYYITFSSTLSFHCTMYNVYYLTGYKIELTAEEQAMSYPGNRVDAEDGSGPGMALELNPPVPQGQGQGPNLGGQG